MNQGKTNKMSAKSAVKIKKKKKKIKKVKCDAAIAQFTKIFENETANSMHQQKKKRHFKTKKNKKTKHLSPKYNNPHHLNNKYIEYIQQFNKKPTISQFSEYCNATYVESKNIITKKQNIAINVIRNSQIIHRHFSQVEPISYKTNPKSKPKSLFSHPYKFINMKTKLQDAFQRMEDIQRERRRIRRGKVEQDDNMLTLINGYCRIYFNIQLPIDVINTLYLLFFDVWWSMIVAAKGKGFDKATIICRSSFVTLECSSPDHIATAWNDGDQFINENQELLNDWHGKSSFCFYGKRYKIYKYDQDENEICCANQDYARGYLDICVVKETKYIWFVLTKEMKSKEGYTNKANITKTFVHAGQFWSDFRWS